MVGSTRSEGLELITVLMVGLVGKLGRRGEYDWLGCFGDFYSVQQTDPMAPIIAYIVKVGRDFIEKTVITCKSIMKIGQMISQLVSKLLSIIRTN
jgi:hypothetical protein